MGNQIGSMGNAKAVYFLSAAGPAVILACLGVGLNNSKCTFGKVGNQLNGT